MQDFHVNHALIRNPVRMQFAMPRVIRIIARLNVGGPAKHVVWLTAGLNEALRNCCWSQVRFLKAKKT